VSVSLEIIFYCRPLTEFHHGLDGASLIYTTPFLVNSLQSLIHSTLGIHSLLRRQSLKHNVIDRDKVIVPANWDSWGKIRIIREGFDIEGVGDAWSIEIQQSSRSLASSSGNSDDAETSDQPASPLAEDGSSAVVIYEQAIKDPKQDSAVPGSSTHTNRNKIEIDTEDMQKFLGQQVTVLDQLKAEDEKDREAKKVPKALEMSPNFDESGHVNEHIGPVQFNMGGIQVDADDMLRKLKVRGFFFFSSPPQVYNLIADILCFIGTRGQSHAKERGQSIRCTHR
jgi:dynein light intermediate chain 1, cytosolic